jgi:hypothetical protein
MNMLIDVHHHALPDFYAAAMRKEGIEEIDGFPIPEWSYDFNRNGFMTIGRSSRYRISDHFDGKRFFNPTAPHGQSAGEIIKYLVSSRPSAWPREVRNDQKLVLNKELSENEVAVTFVNHATVLVQVQGTNILTDPVWSERASPVSFAGPKRVRRPGIEISELKSTQAHPLFSVGYRVLSQKSQPTIQPTPIWRYPTNGVATPSAVRHSPRAARITLNRGESPSQFAAMGRQSCRDLESFFSLAWNDSRQTFSRGGLPSLCLSFQTQRLVGRG